MKRKRRHTERAQGEKKLSMQARLWLNAPQLCVSFEGVTRRDTFQVVWHLKCLGLSVYRGGSLRESCFAERGYDSLSTTSVSHVLLHTEHSVDRSPTGDWVGGPQGP